MKAEYKYLALGWILFIQTIVNLHYVMYAPNELGAGILIFMAVIVAGICIFSFLKYMKG